MLMKMWPIIKPLMELLHDMRMLMTPQQDKQLQGKPTNQKVEPPPDDNMNLTRKESASKYVMSVSNVPQVLRQTSDLMLPKSYKVG